MPSASSLPRSYLKVLSPQLSRRNRFQPRARAWARSGAGSAAAATTKSTCCARWWATPLNPSIHIVHMGQGDVWALPYMKW